MKRRIETSSICVCETKPFFANGEITSIGTRKPRPCVSICGGGTWSHQPPPESHTTMIAALFQTDDVCTCCTRSASQFSPTVTLPLPGWVLCGGFGWTNETAGRLPAASAAVKSLKSRTFGEACVDVKYWNGFCCDIYTPQSCRFSLNQPHVTPFAVSWSPTF